MNKLDKLAIKYGADKFGKHGYTPFYYDLFRNRQESVKKVVEIGVAEGASLHMWHDFFPNAQIYGADIDIKRFTKIFSRTTLLDCDQSIEVDLNKLIKETGTDIDLFIDDGSHKSKDQIFTCRYMMPMLDSNVIYVIEDVADESIAEQLSEYETKVITFSKRYDDRIILVRHPENE